MNSCHVSFLFYSSTSSNALRVESVPLKGKIFEPCTLKFRPIGRAASPRGQTWEKWETWLSGFRSGRTRCRGRLPLPARCPLEDNGYQQYRQRDKQRQPAEPGGQADEDGNGGEDSHADLKGSEAHVGDAVLIERAGLQFRVDDLEQRD